MLLQKSFWTIKKAEVVSVISFIDALSIVLEAIMYGLFWTVCDSVLSSLYSFSYSEFFSVLI